MSTTNNHDDIDRRVDLVFNQPSSTRRRRRWAVSLAVVAAVTIGGLVAASIAGGSQPQRLRTANAELRDVDAELSSVATIEPVTQAAVAFPASGTVATVDVAAGDTVAVGQALATLDTAQLTRTLNQKKETLAQAELALSRALDGESTTDSPTLEPAATSSTTSSEVVLLATSQQPATTDDQLAALQQAVVNAQIAVDQALAASNAAMDNAKSVCASEPEAATDADTTTTTDPTDPCIEALEQVQQAQAATAAAQQQLAGASSALDDYLAASAQNSGQSSGSPTGGSAQVPSGGSSSGPSATSTSPSAADLIAYQKAVSAAELQVLVAQQALDQATIVSPITGTVVAVGFEAGDEVSAASATQTVTVQGDMGVEVVTTIGLSDIASIEIGQSASVLPDGTSETLQGEVVGIAATPDDSSTTTSYRVTVGLTDPNVKLGAGTTGTVTILTGQARAALAVPSSAITWTRDNATVQVVDEDGTNEVPVQIGVVGSDWIEIVSGLDEGTEVVIADLDEPLPTASSDTADNSQQFGGFTGGGPGGGFSPPGG